jgi:hypothetical protein
MHHREELNLEYVIWGQKKWNVDIDQVTSWPNWRPMDDLGSITKNHWFVPSLRNSVVCLFRLT